MIGSSSGGEKALSWQSPGGALTAFELGNAPLFGAFPDRARSLPRETLAHHAATAADETEGVLSTRLIHISTKRCG